MSSVGRSEEGRKNRQAILDYLNANPDASARQLCDALQVEYHPLLTRLRDMRRMNEVVGRFVGHNVKESMLVFSALVTTTAEKYPADQAREEKLFLRQTKAAPASATKKQKPGVTVHRMDDHPPIRNQGGQGCAYSTTRRFGTCLEMMG